MIRRHLIAALGLALVAAGPALAPSGAAAQFTGAQARDLARVTNYLNGTTTLEGEFVQVSPSGDLSTGDFYLRRPGRIRFEYDLPNAGLVIADGTWVGVIDRRAETLDRYPLSETPLDLLLRERVDLRREGAVVDVERTEERIRITAIDPDAPDQGSITMVFADRPLQLRQWVVVDAQGYTTTVALSDMRANVEIDPRKFVIEDPF